MILRVLAGSDLASGNVCPWVTVTGDGRLLRHGASVREEWPSAERIEGVLAAVHSRLVTLRLPGVPRQRLDRAAAYAIEDQLATPIDASAIAAVPASDGTTLVAIAQAELVAAIARGVPRITRLVPEAALAPIGLGWTWCKSGAAGGFVRRGDGSSFTVGTAGNHETLPSELASALMLARRTPGAPERIEVAFEAPAATLAHWKEAAGVPFVAVPAWRWQGADAAAWDRAPDLLAHQDTGTGETQGRAGLGAFRLPLLLLAIALSLDIAALAIQWTALTVERWQASSALTGLAQQAGVAAAGGPDAVAAALASRHRELLHRAGRPALSDPLPLLARAAGPLATLARSTVSAATYGDGAWTLTVAGIDGKALNTLVARMQEAGIDAVGVPVASGVRLRLALDPGDS